MTMIKRDLLSILDVRDDFNEIIQLSQRLKRSRYQKQSVVEGRTMGMIFEKPSTRTRVSLETAIHQLGGNGIYLNPNDMQMGRGETVEDTARVLSGMLDIITYRAFSSENMRKLAEHSSIPIINALDDREHPLQLLADFLTIYEKLGKFSGKKMCYVGDGNNMLNSTLLTCAITGMDLSVATPKGYEPKKEYVEKAISIARETGSRIDIMNDPVKAVENANIVSTDVWVSMGEEKEKAAKEKAFLPYQVNSKLTEGADKNFIFMHCLPAHRGLEVTDEVADSVHSVIFQEAENRLHSSKGAIVYLLSH